MQRARLFGLLIALVTAGLAAYLASKFVPSTKEVVKTSYETVKVLVAKQKIQIGETVKSSHLRWQEWPADAISPEFITNKNNPRALSSLSGSIARTPFLSGEPIKKDRMIKAGDGGVLAAILPSGMRALSVPIKDKNVAGGFILPNDRVDVIVTRRVQGSNGTQQVGETLLHNIRVLAVGKMIDQKGDDKTASGKTATLELDPKQVEIVSMANAMGEISLSLRSLADSGSQTSNGGGRGGTVKMLKFGIPSQAFGVN